MIIETAREWIGTPYRHQHSTKGAGCDCLGLVRGVYREVIGPEPETPPPYSPSWGEVERNEVLLNAASRWLTRVDESEMTVGDVLIFRIRRGMVAKHCGFYSGDGRMIHAYQGSGAVFEHHMGPWWTRRIAAVFRFPEVK